MRFIWLKLLVFIFFFECSFAENSSKRCLKVNQILASTGKSIATYLVYPIPFSYKTWKKYSENKVKEEKIKSLAKAPFLAAWDHPFISALWLAAYMASKTTGISLSDYHDETSDFFEGDPEKDVIVVVDAFKQNDFFYGGKVKLLFDMLYPKTKFKRAMMIKALNDEEFDKQISEIKKTYGEDIKIDYYGHALPGSLIGFHNLTYQSLAWEESDYTRRFMSELNMKHDPSTVSTPVKCKKNISRFNACFLGTGDLGDEYLLGLAIKMYGRDKNGKVYASRFQVYPNATDWLMGLMGVKEPPMVLRKAGDIFTAPVMGPVTLYTSLKFNSNSPKTDNSFLLNRVKILEWKPDPKKEEAIQAVFRELQQDVFIRTFIKVPEDKLKEREEKVEEVIKGYLNKKYIDNDVANKLRETSRQIIGSLK
jgi:hypothetical protein